MGVEIGGREKETRRQRGKEEERGKEEAWRAIQKKSNKKIYFSSRKSWQDEEMGDFLQEKQLLGSVWVGDQLKLCWQGCCTSLPWPCTATAASAASACCHPSPKPAWKSLRRGWAATGTHSSAPAHLLSSLVHPTANPPLLQPLPAEPSRNQISFFSTGTLRAATLVELGVLRSDWNSHMLWMNTLP